MSTRLWNLECAQEIKSRRNERATSMEISRLNGNTRQRTGAFVEIHSRFAKHFPYSFFEQTILADRYY